MCICNKCSDLYIKYFINNVLQLLSKYSWLVDAYILDFFVDRHWNVLPSSWQELLIHLSPEDLGCWLDVNRPFRFQRVWPLSLLALKATASQLSIPRQAEHCHGSINASPSSSHCQHCHFIDLDMTQYEQTHWKIFSKHIKPKKFHEINRMAKVASSCAQELGCQFIVDVGSGLGHLGRLLALRHGLHVCCLEEQTCLTEKARKLDEQLLKMLSKKQNYHSVPPVHVNTSIENAMQSEEFLKLIKKAFNVPDDNFIRFGIVGLHPCGDLGPTLLRLLVNCPGACFINLVGCCYMKLTDDRTVTSTKGYPLSSYTLSLDQHYLGYEAREVACHAIENYTHRLLTGHVSELKVHCYRAVLENIIVKLRPDLKHSGLRSIKNVHDMDFSVYAAYAVEKLGLKLPQLQLESQETKDQLSQWLRVVSFYSLRLLLAPSIESAILLDRMMFLHENGISNFLLPAFDPELSPRNHILIAMKK